MRDRPTRDLDMPFLNIEQPPQGPGVPMHMSSTTPPTELASNIFSFNPYSMYWLNSRMIALHSSAFCGFLCRLNSDIWEVRVRQHGDVTTTLDVELTRSDVTYRTLQGIKERAGYQLSDALFYMDQEEGVESIVIVDCELRLQQMMTRFVVAGVLIF
jgi:hypothetical protein